MKSLAELWLVKDVDVDFGRGVEGESSILLEVEMLVPELLLVVLLLN